MPGADRRRSTRRINAVVALADDALRPGPRRRPPSGRAASTRRPAPRRPVHDQGLDRHRGARHDGRHDRLAEPRPGSRRDGRRPAAGGRRDPARQDEHAGVHLVGRDRQRRLRPDVEPVRPEPDARRQLRRGGRDRRRGRRRRSTSAATPATASASRPTSAASPASSRRRAACRGPATGRRSPGSSASLQQLGPIARRVDDLALVLPIIAGPDGDRPACRAGRRSATRTRVDVASAPRRRLHGQRHPDADARDDRRGRGRRRGGRRRPGRRVDVAGPARPRRGLGHVGSPDPERRPRLAAPADRRRRDARLGLVRDARLDRPAASARAATS